MEVLISDVSCAGLKNTDGSRGTSDPYVVFRPMNIRPGAKFARGEGERRLPPQKNTLAPAWKGAEVSLDLGIQRAPDVGFPEMSVEVWDSDNKAVGHRYDDLLGYASIPLDQPSRSSLTLELVKGNGGTITFSFAVKNWPDPANTTLEPSHTTESVSARLYNVSCSGLRNLDGASARLSDPYVKAHTEPVVTAPGDNAAGLKRLPPIANNLNPSWAGRELELKLDSAGSTVTVEVWDYDGKTGVKDDLLGFARVPIDKAAAKDVEISLESLQPTVAVAQGERAQGSLTLSWSTAGWPSAADVDAAVSGAKQLEEAKAAAKAAQEQAAEKAIAAEEARTAAEAETAKRATELAAAEAAAQKAEEDAESAENNPGVIKDAADAAWAEEQAAAARAAAAEAKKAAEEAAAAKAAAVAEAAARQAEEDKAREAEEQAAAARAAAAVKRKTAKKAGVVTRKEIRSMAPAEQQRFVDALKTMMKNGSGPGTSEYARIAGYHGWGPASSGKGDYCQHGQETFPGWHRAYLVEMEKGLQAADKLNGQDGDLGLPYWDWTNLKHRDVLPRAIRQHFSEMPQDLVTDDAAKLLRYGYSKVPSDRNLRRQISKGKVIDQAQSCVDQEEHWLHASTKHRRGVSVEQPHNSLHMYLGFPMTSVKYAAFYPAFFLHHCNIDRIYSKYIDVEGVSNSQAEFASSQKRNKLQGRKDLYTAPLKPFKHPTRGDDFMSADTFITEDIGYEYDTLPPDAPQRMTAVPTFAVFENVMPLEMNYKSYGLYVFVLTPDDANWTPGNGPDEWLDQPEFAGSGAIFGGKGKECANCVERDPYNILVDISENLYERGISRHEAVIKVMCCDEEGETSALEDTPVPVPYLNGPFFEDSNRMAEVKDAAEMGAAGGDNKAIQLWLLKHGWYCDMDESCLDGWFGPNTQAALKAYQEWASIDVDGIAGPQTKAKMMQGRMDPEGDEKGNETPESKYKPGDTLKYTVLEAPGYLNMQAVAREVEMAFGEWTKAADIHFVQTSDVKESDVVIEWSDTSADNLLPFGTRGGALAVAKHLEPQQKILFDEAERWLHYDQVPRGRNDKDGVGFYFLPVLTHEIGHVLGLKHSRLEDDLMSPYYKTSFELSSNDIARVVGLYGAAKAAAKPAGAAAEASSNVTTAPGAAPQPNSEANPVAQEEVKSGCCITM